MLFTASADLLVAWYTASMSWHRHTWAAAHHRYGALVQRVRQARLGGDVDELEQACRALLHHAQARPVRAPLIRDAFTQLHQTLAWVADDTDICLIGSDTCQHRRRPVRHPRAREHPKVRFPQRASRAEDKPEGPIAVAILAGGVGCPALGVLTTLSEASTGSTNCLKLV